MKTPKFSEKQTVSHFAREVPSDIPVIIGGTGVMAYNTANVEIDFESFKCDFWADGWFAIQATETGVPIIALRHEQGWLQPLQTDGPDIWSLNKQEERASQIDSWIQEYHLWNQ